MLYAAYIYAYLFCIINCIPPCICYYIKHFLYLFNIFNISYEHKGAAASREKRKEKEKIDYNLDDTTDDIPPDEEAINTENDDEAQVKQPQVVNSEVY